MMNIALGRMVWSFYGEAMAAADGMSWVRRACASKVRWLGIVAVVICVFLGMTVAHGDDGENLRRFNSGGGEAEMPRRWLAAAAADERSLLLEFKSLITVDPSAALSGWTNSSSTSLCRWNGIICNSQGSVFAINLTDYNLQGSISPALGQLPSLANLNLTTNNLSGTIPTALLRNASSLISLDLSYNLLSGFIPSDISAPRLASLNLFNNSLMGPIPPSLGNCSALVDLSLHFNSLSGTIPVELGNLVHLQELALSFNQLHGPIPTAIYTNCTNLTLLALSGNALTGFLPPEIGRLSNLQSLWMDGNQLSGSIPEEIGNLTRVNYFRLSENNFTGTIPASISKLVSMTALLSLGLNQLTGPIPRELGNLTRLQVMTLIGNFLNGTIPKELGNLHNLQGLFLADNMLSGTVPGELARCSKLQRLTLDSNRLVGSIPAALGSLQLLYELHLDRNMLEGSIPTSFSNLTSLQDLSLGYNSFHGSLSAITASSASTLVSGFSMPHNLFIGPIPPGVGEMIHVQKIDLSSNNLSGDVPESLGNCVNLLELNLSFNSLNGTVPELGSLNMLQRLDLSGNFLSGSIPDSLSSLPQLEYLNLSFNNFTGQIPITGVFAHLNASSFLSNPGLCGYPLTQACPRAVATSSPSSENGLEVGFKILIIISCLLAFAIFLLLVRYTCFANRRIDASHRDQEVSPILSPGQNSYSNRLIKFAAHELEAATENFSDDKIIGTGNVGKVYRVSNLPIRLVPTVKKADVAIKRLRGVDQRSTLSVELNTLGQVRHRNLVEIYGYCDQRDVQALVLEFLSKGSLQKHLHADEAPYISLWLRLQIALGVAHGMAYLHHGLKNQIVHRDLKPSNILLDENMVAKVADFGIAKMLGPETLYSALKGTPGYLAPECGESLRVNAKGDVYSYGIVVLELLTRRQPTDDIFEKIGTTMPNWVRAAYPDRYMEVLDPQLQGDSVELTVDEALRALLRVGLACVQIKPIRRPNMESVVKKLDAIVSLLSRDAKPDGLSDATPLSHFKH